MQPYQQRVVEEKKALDDKRKKLGAFIATEPFNLLDTAERGRLLLQAHYMREYSHVLAERIAAFP